MRTLLLLSAVFSASLAASATEAQVETAKKPAPVRSTGCDAQSTKSLADPGGASTRIKLGDRFFRLTLPVNYAADQPAPLIIAFHDFESSARKLEKASLLSHPSYNKDAVVAYPEAAEDVSLPPNVLHIANSIQSRWMSDADQPAVDDIGFTTSLIDRLGSRLCIDTDRVYVAGQGTGGGLAHLLACSPDASAQIAAYALVNGNVLQGTKNHIGPAEVKDPARMLWERCKPARSGPVRIVSVHSENNTVYDYWGEMKSKDKKRLGTVRWLVDWAHANKCGMGLEMPTKWRGKWDKVYKTRLHQGYIFEGFVENGTVTKAMYHCWYGDSGENVGTDAHVETMDEEAISSKLETDPSSNTESAETSESTEAASEETQPKEENLAEFVEKLRDSVILEHYFLRNYGHGWPRVKRAPSSPDDTGYAWEPMTEAPEEELDLSFDSERFTFHYGFDDPDPKTVTFDSTARVLDFFRMFRLSDPSPKAPRDELGLTEVESDVLKKLVKDIREKMESDEQEQQERREGVEVEEAAIEQAEAEAAKDEL